MSSKRSGDQHIVFQDVNELSAQIGLGNYGGVRFEAAYGTW